MPRANVGDDCNEYFRYTCKARLSRDMHILEGYVRGISADSRIRDIELKCLINWLSEHSPFADHHPFCEVIPRIQRIIRDGIVDEEERADLLWLSQKFTTDDLYYDNVTSDLQRLHGILGGIVSDGRITKTELSTLKSWVDERSFLSQCWPYDYLGKIIGEVLRDGRIDPQEHEALMQFFGEFVAAGDRSAVGVLEQGVTVSGVCAMSPVIEFENRGFCFTGSSKRCTKKELANVVVALGGHYHDNLRSDTAFLVVGANGNPCWAYSCYGRKVEDAVERQRQGQLIVITHEFDFWYSADASKAIQIGDSSESSTDLAPRPGDRKQRRKPSQSRKTSKESLQKTDLEREQEESASTCTVSSVLSGKKVVVTGKLEKYTRDEIHALVEKLGGRAASSVSKNTDFVVAGESAGSKLAKARELGVQVISEAEFERIVNRT